MNDKNCVMCEDYRDDSQKLYSGIGYAIGLEHSLKMKEISEKDRLDGEYMDKLGFGMDSKCFFDSLLGKYVTLQVFRPLSRTLYY